MLGLNAPVIHWLFGIGRSDFVTLGWTPCKVRGLSLVGHRLLQVLQLFAAGGPGARGLQPEPQLHAGGLWLRPPHRRRRQLEVTRAPNRRRERFGCLSLRLYPQNGGFRVWLPFETHPRNGTLQEEHTHVPL